GQFETVVAEAFAEEAGQAIQADAADVGADGLDGAVEQLLGGQAGEVLQCAHGKTPGCGGDCGPRLGGGMRTLTIAGAGAGNNVSMASVALRSAASRPVRLPCPAGCRPSRSCPLRHFRLSSAYRVAAQALEPIPKELL